MSRLIEVTINEPLNDAVSQYVGLDNAVREYLALKAQMEQLQERMREVRIPIEEALALRGEPMEIAGFNCVLLPCERENFNLKEAKKHIRVEILAPYTSLSSYNQLRISEITGKK